MEEAKKTKPDVEIEGNQAAKPDTASGADVPAIQAKNDLVITGEFGKYDIVKVDATALAAVRENVGEGQLTQFDLDRVKIPAGGGLAWEIPGDVDDNPDIAREFEALIFLHVDQRAYWKKSIDESGGGSPPDCWSADAKTGIGDPGGDCSRCPFSKFGSAALRPGEGKSKGQACKQIKLMFLIRPTGILPLALALPPTSLKPAKKYLLRLGSKGIPYYGTLTKFTLKKENSGGNDYSVVQLAPDEKLTPAQFAFVQKLRGQLLPAIRTTTLCTEDFIGNTGSHTEGEELPAM